MDDIEYERSHRDRLISLLYSMGVGFDAFSDVVVIESGRHDKVEGDNLVSVVFVFEPKNYGKLARVEINQ